MYPVLISESILANPGVIYFKSSENVPKILLRGRTCTIQTSVCYRSQESGVQSRQQKVINGYRMLLVKESPAVIGAPRTEHGTSPLTEILCLPRL